MGPTESKIVRKHSDLFKNGSFGTSYYSVISSIVPRVISIKIVNLVTEILISFLSFTKVSCISKN